MIDKDCEWVIRCINSCDNGFQLKASYALIELFSGKYEKELHYSKFHSLLLDTIHARESQISLTA